MGEAVENSHCLVGDTSVGVDLCIDLMISLSLIKTEMQVVLT